MKDIAVYKNMLSKEICDKIISMSQTLPEDEMHIKGAFEFKLRNESIEEVIKKISHECLHDYLKDTLSCIGGYDYNCANVLIYEQNTVFPIHLDNPCVLSSTDQAPKTRTLGMLIFLNSNFTGGELIFPEQDKFIVPEIGTLVIFPFNHLYPHLVNAVVGDRRYVLRINYFKNEKWF